MKANLRSALFYTVFAMAVTLVMAGWHFPVRAFVQWGCRQVAPMAPQWRLQCSDATLKWPPALHLGPLQVWLQGREMLEIQWAEVSLRPPSLNPWQWRFGLQGAVAGGSVGGTAARSASRGLDLDLDLDGLGLERIGAVGHLGRRQVSGALKGKVVWRSRTNRQGVLKTRLALTGGRIELIEPVMGHGHLDFDRLDIAAAWAGGRWTIDGLDLTGPQMHMVASGSVQMRNPAHASPVSLNGRIRPSAPPPSAPGGPAAPPDTGFAIHGTIGRPLIELGTGQRKTIYD